MTGTLSDWDPTDLRRIISLAGPQDGVQILHHLRADLESARETLLSALAARDNPTLRRASHVLIALCGTAGARSLHRTAEEFHGHLLQGTEATATALADRLAEGVLGLSALISDELARWT
ncbi:MAG: hypothetical protein IH625_05645 [Rhodobacteraceae bacterium]|nr:hypothetical protein [Paracoccaceae bacterium]